MYSAQAVDICLQEHSVEEQLRLSSLLEQLNSEDLLLHALSFLRTFLGRYSTTFIFVSSGTACLKIVSSATFNQFSTVLEIIRIQT